MSKAFVCPYCFSRQDLYQIQFRCQNDPTRCAPADDEPYARFIGLTNRSLKMNRVFDYQGSKRRVPRRAPCDHCGEYSSRRVCPACHNELPYTIGDFQDLIISVIGAKESGKSHYISVLIHMIENKVGRAFNCNLQKLDDNTIRKYREEFYNPVFRNHTVIPETRSARGDYNVKMPMVFSLSFMRKNLLGRARIHKLSTISFFDTAGEDLNSEDTMRNENKYIFNSSGIILLIDPLQLPNVRNQLSSHGVALPYMNTETEDIIARVAKLIRNGLQIPANKLIEIPLAVAFSKIDAIAPLLDSHSALFTPPGHEGFYNVSDGRAIHAEIENMLAQWAGEDLLLKVEQNFRHHAFFGLSALGCNPHGSTRIEKLRPHRVSDPFLWLLYRNKVIKGKKN
ncbi:MAG: hypothetical protein ACK4VN_13350 [Bacteroidales bacterium]